jgi:NitT/TauT family transport system permease protein
MDIDAAPAPAERLILRPREEPEVRRTRTSSVRTVVRRHRLRWSIQVAGVGAVILLWAILVPALGVPTFLWPRLPDVAQAFTQTFVTLPAQQGLTTPGGGVYDVVQTLTATLAGYAIGSVAAILLAVLASEFRVLDFIIQPFVSALQALPKIALAPLFLVWFGLGTQGHIALVVSLVVFPVMLSAYAGLRFVPDDFVELARTLRTGRARMLVLVKLPASLPSLFTGLSVGIVYALLGAIVAEFLSGQTGLGAELVVAQANSNTAAVFAVLAVLAVLGAALNGAVSIIGRRVVFWAGKR